MTLIPDPVIGGVFTIGLGMVSVMGFSSLKHVDPTSTRNLTILSLALMIGLMVPPWIREHPKAINTGMIYV